MFQRALCAFRVSCACPVSPTHPACPLFIPRKSPHVPCLSPVCVPASCVSPSVPHVQPGHVLRVSSVCSHIPHTCPPGYPMNVRCVSPRPLRVRQRPHIPRVSPVCPMHPTHPPHVLLACTPCPLRVPCPTPAPAVSRAFPPRVPTTRTRLLHSRRVSHVSPHSSHVFPRPVPRVSHAPPEGPFPRPRPPLPHGPFKRGGVSVLAGRPGPARPVKGPAEGRGQHSAGAAGPWGRARRMYTLTRGPSKLATQRRTGTGGRGAGGAGVLSRPSALPP